MVALSVAPSFGQTIYIANSAPGAIGGTNVFTGSNSINLALAAASTGDIIYVVPSSVVYTTPTLGGKGVTIIGGGFNPDKPGGLRSTVGAVYANANNFRLSGLVITSELNIPGSFSNIMIDKCRIGSIGDGSGGSAKGNLTIVNCIIEGQPSGSGGLYIGSGSTNVRIANNIIYCYSPSVAAVHRLNGAVIENNIFIGSASGGTLAAFEDVTNSNIKNNIFYGIRPYGMHNGTTSLYSGNTAQNNLSFGASDNVFPTIDGNTSANNIEAQDPVFSNLPFGTAYSFSYDATLQAGSPAIGTGFGGTDMGIFGGLSPFDVYGTSLPIVQTIIAPASVTQGTNMDVRVNAKGN